MEDESLEEEPADLLEHIEEDDRRLDKIYRESQQQMKQMQEQMNQIVDERKRISERRKAVTTFQKAKNTPPAKVLPQKRKRYEPIHETVRATIREQIKFKTWDEIQTEFKVSRGAIQKILKEDPNAPKRPKLSGRKSIFNDSDNLVQLLYWIEENPRLTLCQLVKKFSKRHIETSSAAIYRALKKAKVGWKTSIKIPIAWNQPSVIAERAEFVQKILLDEGKNCDYLILFKIYFYSPLF